MPILEKNKLGLKAAREGSSLGEGDVSTWRFRRSAKIQATASRAMKSPRWLVAWKAPRAIWPPPFMDRSSSVQFVFRRPAAAEMTKLLENIYRCVNIALVNELKLLSLRMGIDIWEVIEAAKTKPFGFQAFYPGPGLGGHCIPVDPYYLSWKAKEFDFQTRFIELAGDVNSAMPYHVVSSVTAALNKRRKSLNGSKVLVLGVAYKKDIDDLRESPSLTMIELLQKEGAEVSYNDPYFAFVGKGRKYDLQMKNTPLENLGQYDCVLIVTDHSDYDYKKIVAESKLVVDTRNATKGIHADNLVHC